MRTIVNKFIFGFLFLLLSWKGLDGLLINYHSREQYEADIQDVVSTGIKDNRFLQIKNGLAVGTFIYTEENAASSLDVIYPLISAEQARKMEEGKTVTAKLLVKVTDMSRKCLEDGTCFLPDSTTIAGLTQNDLVDLNKEQYQLLETDQVKIAPDAKLVEMGTKPISSEWNFLMFLGGGIFALTILKSFFRKAENLEDYWEKVTEKKMA